MSLYLQKFSIRAAHNGGTRHIETRCVKWTEVKCRTLDMTNWQVRENNCRTKSVSELKPLVATGEITLNDLDFDLKLIWFLWHFVSNPNQITAFSQIKKSNQNPQIFRIWFGFEWFDGPKSNALLVTAFWGVYQSEMTRVGRRGESADVPEYSIHIARCATTRKKRPQTLIKF